MIYLYSRKRLLRISLLFLCVLIFGVIGYTLIQTDDVKQVKVVQSGTDRPEEQKQVSKDSSSEEQTASRPLIKPAKGIDSGKKPKEKKVLGPENAAKTPETSDSVDDNIYVRVQDVLSLRENPSQDSVDLLVQFLNDPSVLVVQESIDTLGFIALKNGELKGTVLQVLTESAMDKDFPERGHALITAAIVGKEKTLPLVSKFLSEDREGVEDYAVRALSLINSPESVPLLQSVLETAGDGEVRRNCINVLARIDTPETLDMLKTHAASSKGSDQAASVAALSRLNRADSNQMLMDLVKDDRLGEKALLALSMSPSAPIIYSELLNGADLDLDRKISLIRSIRNDSLYAPGKTRGEIVQTLTPLLDSEETEIQVETLKTISQLGGGEEYTAELLLPKLKASDPEVRREALSSFLAYTNPWNYKDLLDLVFDENEETRRMALFASERFVDNSDLEILERAANSEDEFIRERAKKLLDLLNQT